MNIELRKSLAQDSWCWLLSKNSRNYWRSWAIWKLSEVNIKKLKGEGDYYRIRVGDYRIGMKVNDGVVSFVRILHRKEIYRYFP